MATPTDKIWTREDIDALLISSDAAVERGIIVLFHRQTSDEQSDASTNHQNNRGFASCDARAGTRFARFLLGMNDRNQVRYPKKRLTHPISTRIFNRYTQGAERPIDRARRIVLKHSRQLVEEANLKASKEA